MKVLFVCSGNVWNGIGIIVKNQGESLKRNGVDLEYFPVKGKGIKGYVKNIYPLRKLMRRHSFDIVHAHYFLSGLVARLAGANPLVVSLMGSDIQLNLVVKLMFKMFKPWIRKHVIVKSETLKRRAKIKQAEVIPNGVDFTVFRPMKRTIAREKLDLDLEKRIILFVADPERLEKNFTLAQKATNLLNDRTIDLKIVHDVEHRLVPLYLNAADVLLLTSLWEGSPNVIKEAMACNCPIVSTDVGDVKEVVGEADGCYITSFDPEDVAEKIKLALSFGRRTNGRERVRGLESNLIAKRIIKFYKNVLAGN